MQTAARGHTAMPSIAVKAIAIDLDGTLLDTAPGLAEAANRMLAELQLPQMEEAQVKTYIGNGLLRLIKRVLTRDMQAEPAAELLAQALPLYERHYAAVANANSHLYAGVIDGLELFRRSGFRLACITNKAEKFTLPLLQSSGILDYFELVLSGDSLPQKKPHPMPLLHTCRQFAIAPHELLLIGDSINDAQAARAAGSYVFCVTYGYNRGQPVSEIGADAVVEHLPQAAALIIKT